MNGAKQVAASGQSIELELTFLPAFLPKEIKGLAGTQLLDIYIPDTLGVHAVLRLRQKGDAFEITKKIIVSGTDQSAHLETTIPLNAQEFASLASSSKKRVSKVRYNVLIDGYAAEVDVFRGSLAGLVMIDFEFESEEEKARFVAPSICLADVTQEEFVAGGQIAGKSYADIADDLARFDYKPIL